MDRRSILVSLAAMAAAGPALAQATMPAGPGPMGPAEMEHARKTAMTGAVALQTSDIALDKARGAKVKEFAKFEHDEQTTVAEILKSMDPSMTPPAPDPKMADMVQKLKAMKAGRGFDRAYIAGQIEGHQMLLQIQEEYLAGGKNREHLSIAKLVRGMVKEHLTLLADLNKAAG